MSRRQAVLCRWEYEQCLIAIKKVASGHKPFAEVSGTRARKTDLEHDLAMCLEKSGHTGKVFFWIRPMPMKRWKTLYRYRYGFYRESWTLVAFDFIHQLPRGFHRDWIAGLFFGYSPASIQKFLEKQKVGT